MLVDNCGLHHPIEVAVVMAMVSAAMPTACDGVLQRHVGFCCAEEPAVIDVNATSNRRVMRSYDDPFDGRAILHRDDARIGETGRAQHQPTCHDGQPNSLEHDVPFPWSRVNLNGREGCSMDSGGQR